jgi:hypothetical protein
MKCGVIDTVHTRAKKKQTKSAENTRSNYEVSNNIMLQLESCYALESDVE